MATVNLRFIHARSTPRYPKVDKKVKHYVGEKHHLKVRNLLELVRPPHVKLNFPHVNWDLPFSALSNSCSFWIMVNSKTWCFFGRVPVLSGPIPLPLISVS